MPKKDISRITRLTALLTQLQSKSLITASEIATNFEVSIRTIYRDIRTLEEAGVPIFSREGKGYSLVEGYRIPPIMFTEDEANALITAERFIQKNNDASLAKNYGDALLKVKAVLQSRTKDKLDLLSERIFIFNNQKRSSNYLAEIQIAITTFKLIKINYLSLYKNTHSTRKLEPLALYHTNENWILVAWCKLRDAYREFRLDQIKDLKLLDDSFKPHNFNLREYFESCT